MPEIAATLLRQLGRFRLIVFDCDGTLVDSQHNIIASVRRVFESIDLPPPPDDLIRRQVGLPVDTAIARLAPAAGDEVHQRLAAAFLVLKAQMQAEKKLEEPLYAGMRELIDELQHPELFLGIATGKGRAGLDYTLQLHGLDTRFHTLQTGDRCRGKPHPEMMLRAIEEVGLSPAQAVMIGDTSFDMEMARSAGATAVGVAWGYHDRQDLDQAGAHAVIEHPSQLLGLLSRLAAG
ncbi:MAG: HAD-IA family hydrolase [Dongiaceae bacterium]